MLLILLASAAATLPAEEETPARPKPTLVFGTTIRVAEAYAHALAAFYAAFPEYKTNELYLTGESYFGQYGTDLVAYALEAPRVPTLPLALIPP